MSQVVYHYGDICQAVTEVAAGHRAPITVNEFHILNRCLDTAIAEAVTEHARITAESSVTQEVERMGQLAHDIRDGLNTALIAFNVVKGGSVSITGNTGAVLGRSLLQPARPGRQLSVGHPDCRQSSTPRASLADGVSERDCRRRSPPFRVQRSGVRDSPG